MKRTPTSHAGGKWQLGYKDAWDNNANLSADVNFVSRVPLWPTMRRRSHRLGRWQATNIQVLDAHEIAAGKLAALYDRGASRDLFDAGLIPHIPGLDPSRLRTAFVVYGAKARTDWRSVCESEPTVDIVELSRQLMPSLPRHVRDATPSDTAYLDTLTARADPAMRMVLPFTTAEQAFLDHILDHGHIDPGLLTGDRALQKRIEINPWLAWKTINVRRQNTLMAQQRRRESSRDDRGGGLSL